MVYRSNTPQTLLSDSTNESSINVRNGSISNFALPCFYLTKSCDTPGIPIHLLEEGYDSIIVTLQAGLEGLAITGEIDPIEDWIIRIRTEAFCPDAKIRDRATHFAIVATKPASLNSPEVYDVVSTGVITVEHAPYYLGPRPFEPIISNVTLDGCIVTYESISSENLTYRVAATITNQPPDDFTDYEICTSPHTITGLPGPMNYWVHVKASDGKNSIIGSSQMFQIGGGLDSTPPTLTGSLQLTSDDTSISLDWPEASDDVGVVGYVVEYGLTSDYGSSLSREDTTATITGLVSGAVYYCKVRAIDANGNFSTPALTANISTTGSPGNTGPILTGPLIATPGAGQVSLSWPGASGGATGYEIQYGLLPGGVLQIPNTVNTYATVAGLSSSTLYFFNVRAYDALGNFSDWITASATVNASGPAAFTPTLSNFTAAGCTVSFNSASATSYKVAVINNIMPPTDWSAYPNRTSPYTITGLPGPMNYWVHVKASNGALSTIGISEMFQIGGGVPEPPADFTPTLSNFTAAGCTVSFNSNGASSYKVLTTITEVPVNFESEYWEPCTSPYTITGLPGPMNYWVHIFASNNVGNTYGTSAMFQIGGGL